jgi:hypothetical protein
MRRPVRISFNPENRELIVIYDNDACERRYGDPGQWLLIDIWNGDVVPTLSTSAWVSYGGENV